ncbi:MAG TPA: S41 family peptidase [Candidatus Pacearchaeota archaeon]|nr:S41 family peptidase [Candidatus Pacearchaeota archaeon]HOL90403.1 S41 family peptidase [Candidatus Pacearchaeota archaeon]
MKSHKKIFLVLFQISLFLVIFIFGFYVGKNQVVCKVCPPEKVDLSLIWETWDKLEKKFVDKERIKPQEMIYGAAAGMVKSLNDPYTVFFKPDETKKFLEDVSGYFEGVGMEVGIKKNQLQVISPIKGSPAEKAGLMPGDKIIKINDTFTSDLTIDEAVSLIRGPKDTEVSLTILRDGWDNVKEFKIKRAVIEVPSLEWELKNNDIAYIKIYEFSEKANYDFPKVAKEILNSPAKKIIIDLRNNPGGYLEVAKNIADWFLEKDEIVVIEDFRYKNNKIVYKTNGNAKLLKYPLVVLINSGSASASEILAAALRDNRGVKLVGEKSFGKGSVQELETLSDGSSIKITVADWLTPKENKITDVGLEPDIKVELTEKDFEEGKDPQLEKAIELLK